MYATKFQRAVTYIIDFFIIGVIASLLSQLVYFILPIDMSNMAVYEKELISEYENFISAAYSNMNYDMARLIDVFFEYTKYLLIDFGIVSLIYLPLVIGYLVILPIYWDKQTIGRLVMKVKVVSADNQPISKKQIIIRELVGSYLMYCVIAGPLLFVSIILVCIKGRSIIDYLAKTNLVSILEFEEDVNKDYMDAEFKEVNNDEYVEAKFVDSNNNSSDTDDSNNNDEYKII